MQGDYYRIVTAVLLLAFILVVPLAAWLGLRAGRKRGSAERALPRFGKSYSSEPALDGKCGGPVRSAMPTWLRAAMDTGASVRCVHATSGEPRHSGMVLGYRDFATVVVADGSGRTHTWPVHAIEPDPEGGDYDIAATLLARSQWLKFEHDAEQVVRLRQRGAVPIGYRTALGTDRTLKSVREVLCAAESAPLTTGLRAVLADLLREIDIQRPLAADGKHHGRGLCTPWCQCETQTGGKS